jgi:hypothetical protein
MRIPSMIPAYIIVFSILLLHPVFRMSHARQGWEPGHMPCRAVTSEPRLLREQDTRRAKEGPGEGDLKSTT